ncbi:hypothetical protein QYE76_007941 [Lolium multiflorum]|uniref:Uncharacterized protein n=1 Tax=Lolium multiflorum TaxID=4521 RepID=A0AAD8QJM5_LOLMU|nr:hypothetical protein QYE76_007941 [Lolium multiflorum]
MGAPAARSPFGYITPGPGPRIIAGAPGVRRQYLSEAHPGWCAGNDSWAWPNRRGHAGNSAASAPLVRRQKERIPGAGKRCAGNTCHRRTSLVGCDPSSLLTFDPDSIEPAAPNIGEEPNLGAVDGPLQRLKVLLSSPVDTLVEDPETIRGILVDIQPRLPVVLRLNEKKAALDAKTATSTHSARLETLRKELEDLERRARETKQLIQDEESLIARSQEEAQGLTADLKTDLAEIRALSSQLVMGRDEDDEVEIAEVDRIRADALHALNAFLQ